ncbi:MAG: 3-isopropylmalate dehydratase small subunit [Gracilibacteraceae bacterium]|jgi:3-isopropylmalate/(R)-2-methylmalate dehydratase small subunit|nr:3-isopropylmalate dehydratase small subunit [Gracilibacteraceae bacterium]
MATAWVLPDAINTDIILPGRYISLIRPEDLAKHALEGWNPQWASAIQPRDVIIGGMNFGCGSSREQAPAALKGLGISCVIAKSFARIFYRNAINIGLLVLEIRMETDKAVTTGELVVLSPDYKRLSVASGEMIFELRAPPDFLMELIQAGGIVAQLQKNQN